MKTVVITGSSRGIGFNLAEQFIKNHYQVVLSGRSFNALSLARIKLLDKYPDARIHTVPCDVSNYEQVENLWKQSINQFGQIDIWINNAGQAHSQAPGWEHHQSIMESVVNTNILGVMFGSKVAMQGMIGQGFGSIYNMEGLGSDGRMVDGLSIYGTSKAAVRYFTRSLIKEAANTPVIVGTLSPGMVMTDLIRKQYKDQPEQWEQAKRIFNILADKPHTIAAWMVPQIIENKINGIRIAWLTQRKVLWRFISSLWHKRDVAEENEFSY
jgi:short-subunit dehydrogenase